ncbi:MAG: IS1634 family transposase [Betaproteobacteria bacterium]|nr:IS1634 family transposase [Betaproteobacteria bacterium]
MFLRESKQKRADGTTLNHLQLAENVWDPDRRRSTTRIIYSFGRGDDPEVTEKLRKRAKSILRRCSPEEIVAADGGWKLIAAWPYGDVYALEALWERLGLSSILRRLGGTRRFGFDVERALFAMVANRACAPGSKLYCFEQWLKEDVKIRDAQALSLQHLYRAMDFLEANKDEIERDLYFHVADLLSMDVDLLFYDTTSLHFEVDEEDEGAGPEGTVHGSIPAGHKEYPAPRKRGHAKNGRGDVPQIVVGLAVTRDGFPVRHWVFPGNTVDVTTIKQVKADLKEWKLTRCLFVGDAGMVSKDNLKTLSAGGGKYLLGMPMRRGDEVTQEVLAWPGRFQKIADNLEVKEVIVGEGERRRRYALCFNPKEAERQRLHRETLLTELKAELDSLGATKGDHHTKRMCALRTSGRYGRYVKESAKGTLKIDMAKVRSEERFDGKFVVQGNDDSLTVEDMALGYKQLQRVEECWRTMKSGLNMRPVFHWAPHRIHAHIAITVLSLLLERVAEHACQDSWRNICDDLKRVQLAQLFSPQGTVWQVTDPTPSAAKRLKELGIKAPPPILDVE